MNLQKQEPLPKYSFYPSLLDSFQRYLHLERDFESLFNIDPETGEYKRSFEEMEAEALQELIDRINRVPFDSEAADRGTAFNCIVDAVIHQQRPDRVQMRGVKQDDKIEAKIGERTFRFSYDFIEETARYFAGSLSQVRVSATIDTCYGLVELHGDIDELRGNKVYDIKTTSRYEFGKYGEGWQRHVYPYCLLESGMCTEIESFEYTAYQLKGGTSRTPLITGTQYPEVYTYDHGQSTALIRSHVERFIEFLEEHKDKITDKKIFCGV